MVPWHPIFNEIKDGNLEAVQQRVLADAAVLEERESNHRRTPLMCAIYYKKPAIALFLIEHRGQHGLQTADDHGATALHDASWYGLLEVVQVLVAAGADPAFSATYGITPLMLASEKRHTDIVAFLLRLPAVKATIDHINQHRNTALSLASYCGHQPTVQLLLDAGANPTLPRGQHSPLNCALTNNHHAIAALLRHAIAEPDRVRECVAAVGKKGGLSEDLYSEILKCLLHAWAFTEEEEYQEDEEEEGEDGSGSGDDDSEAEEEGEEEG